MCIRLYYKYYLFSKFKFLIFRDACFSDYHCNDLPNTACSFDKNIPKYNSSCQCIKGNKPFDPNPRTGLIEGCAPLTDADKATILGCATRFKIQGTAEWVPEVLDILQDCILNLHLESK